MKGSLCPLANRFDFCLSVCHQEVFLPSRCVLASSLTIFTQFERTEFGTARRTAQRPSGSFARSHAGGWHQSMRPRRRAIAFALAALVCCSSSAHGFVSGQRAAAGLAGRGGRGARLLSDQALAVWASLTAFLGEGHRRDRAFAQHGRAPQAVEQDVAQNGAMEPGAGHMNTVEYDRRRRAFAGRESRVDMLRRVSCQRPTQVCPLTLAPLLPAPTPIAADPSPWGSRSESVWFILRDAQLTWPVGLSSKTSKGLSLPFANRELSRALAPRRHSAQSAHRGAKLCQNVFKSRGRTACGLAESALGRRGEQKLRFSPSRGPVRVRVV